MQGVILQMFYAKEMLFLFTQLKLSYQELDQKWTIIDILYAIFNEPTCDPCKLNSIINMCHYKLNIKWTTSNPFEVNKISTLFHQ